MKLLQLLEERYPNHSFEKAYLLRGKYAQQNRLEKAVKALFPVAFYPSRLNFSLTLSHIYL